MKRFITYTVERTKQYRSIWQAALVGSVLGILIPAANATNVDLAKEPLFLVQGAEPLMMLTMSKDHQLFFKAFDDYSDLDGDGAIDTGYKHSITYYGYFDPYKCYDYSTTNNRFQPAEYTTTKYCEGDLANKWSGNFLNWASMTRIDVTRKILYGGLRSTQDDTTTVLERANLPTDSHSFVKYYNGTDLGKLTPFGSAQGVDGAVTAGISICNTTPATSDYSHNTTTAPVIRVAQGAWLRWAAQESDQIQCSWRTSPDPAAAINFGTQSIYPGRPDSNTQKLAEHIARVEVCKTSLINSTSSAKTTLSELKPAMDNEESCKAYTDVNRPIGLLHTYGESNRMYFGLMTGSYTKNISGGVLRKNIDSFQNEVDQTTGKFNNVPGIVKTIDALRIYGYKYSAKNYDESSVDGCTTGSGNPQWQNGKCASWGNPQSEIFLEGLRYMANKGTPRSEFNADDSAKFPALAPVSWQDPMTKGEYCSALSILQFNASTTSWDGDELGGTSTTADPTDDIGLSDLSGLTNQIGVTEDIKGKSYFIGLNGIDNNRVCSAKTITDLSSAQGICPEEPRLKGSYQLAGLAWYANTTDMRLDKYENQTIKTFGVALSPAVPKIEVPFGTTQKVTILPACYNTTSNTTGNQEGTCGLVEFRQIESTSTGAKYLVLWETNDKGADYDRDIQGVLEYSTETNKITVSTYVENEGTGAKMLFGYVISGTDKDGFHAHSGNTEDGRGDGKYPGLVGTPQTDPTGVITCNGTGTRCNTGVANRTSQEYTVSNTTAAVLQPPLFYAAKWGGFSNNPVSAQATGINAIPDVLSEYDADGAGIPDNYFFANDPAKLNEALSKAFAKVLEDKGSSASAVASNAKRLDTDTVIYQAKFNPSKWSGELIAYNICDRDKKDAEGNILCKKWQIQLNKPKWSTNNPDIIPDASERNIFTWNNSKDGDDNTIGGVAFLWDNLNTSQQNALKIDLPSNVTTDSAKTAFAQKRLNWLRGSDTDEGSSSTDLRDRPSVANKTTDGSVISVNIVLGDIVNSDPVYVGQENYGLEVLEDIDGAPEKPSDELTELTNAPLTYREFVASKANKKKLIIIGANDGMLHAFDADKGKELFAYIPDNIFSKLHKLTQSSYSHDYFVDGSITVSDAFINGQWRTIMVGSTGAGGNAVFAIDITDREFDGTNIINEDDVLWEYAPSDVGATVSQPRIGRLANNRWAAIFSSGYPTTSTTNNLDRLIIVDLETGELIKEISTGVNSGGLSTPTLVPNYQRIITTVYAGDMQGKVWKFDISKKTFNKDTNADVWKVAYGTKTSPAALFQATDDSNVPQPITAPITFGTNPNGGVMLYFGTGQYFATGDNIVPESPQVQSYYGINDKGATVSKTQLVQQSILAQTGDNFTVSQNAVNYTGTNPRRGWYLNLTTPSGTGVGARVYNKTLLRFGRINFIATTPSKNACAGGGNSAIFELNALNGNMLKSPAFDTNNDGVIDKNDTPIAGKVISGIVEYPAVISDKTDEGDTTEMKVMGKNTGDFQQELGNNGGNQYKKRQSWRQMK